MRRSSSSPGTAGHVRRRPRRSGSWPRDPGRGPGVRRLDRQREWLPAAGVVQRDQVRARSTAVLRRAATAPLGHPVAVAPTDAHRRPVASGSAAASASSGIQARSRCLRVELGVRHRDQRGRRARRWTVPVQPRPAAQVDVDVVGLRRAGAVGQRCPGQSRCLVPQFAGGAPPQRAGRQRSRGATRPAGARSDPSRQAGRRASGRRPSTAPVRRSRRASRPRRLDLPRQRHVERGEEALDRVRRRTSADRPASTSSGAAAAAARPSRAGCSGR